MRHAGGAARDPVVEPDLLPDPENPCNSEWVLWRTDLTQSINYGTSVWQSPRVDIGSANFFRNES